MVKFDSLLIRFGELNTKGKNKQTFINLLFENIKFACKDIDNLNFIKSHDRIYIKFEEEQKDELVDRIKQVSGISNFSLVYSCESNANEIADNCLELIKNKKGNTFKVKAKRADKNFPIHSEEMNRIVATKILKNTDFKVDVHEPDILVSIDIRLEGTFIYLDKIEGAGGYPLGVAGKGLVMLSGGIDSPVCAYMAMNRGLKIECIHFASPPYTSDLALNKVTDLLKVLSKNKQTIKLHVIPFTRLQEEIYKNVDESYAITIMRRMMYRISEKIARNRNCLVLLNGESIGQVASQTLYSMKVINEVVNLPVIRPLACMDKEEIMKIARKINTYDISIRPYTDCCTIFTPHNPTTRPDSLKCEEYEKKFDYEALVSECCRNEQIFNIDPTFNLDDIEKYF